MTSAEELLLFVCEVIFKIEIQFRRNATVLYTEVSFLLVWSRSFFLIIMFEGWLKECSQVSGFFFLLTFHIKPLLGQSYSYDVCGNTCKAVGNLEFWTEGALSHRHTAAVRPNVGVMCPLVVTSGPDRSLHNLSHTVINMNDLFFESQRKGFCWGFQLVFYTIYVKDFFSCVSLTICFCIDWNVLSFVFFFTPVAVWWSLHHLYTHERALLSPEPCCLHRTLRGLLRPCTTVWGVSL